MHSAVRDGRRRNAFELHLQMRVLKDDIFDAARTIVQVCVSEGGREGGKRERGGEGEKERESRACLSMNGLKLAR